MVMLRNSGGVGAESVATTPKRRSVELDTSSEFLSLLPASQRKSARLTRSSRPLDDSFSSPENNAVNVSLCKQTTGDIFPFVLVDKRKLFCYISASVLS